MLLASFSFPLPSPQSKTGNSLFPSLILRMFYRRLSQSSQKSHRLVDCLVQNHILFRSISINHEAPSLLIRPCSHQVSVFYFLPKSTVWSLLHCPAFGRLFLRFVLIYRNRLFLFPCLQTGLGLPPPGYIQNMVPEVVPSVLFQALYPGLLYLSIECRTISSHNVPGARGCCITVLVVCI